MKALERARIENGQRDAEKSSLAVKRELADQRLASVEEAVIEIGLVGKRQGNDAAIEPRLNIVTAFVREESGSFAALGPGQLRRSQVIERDFEVLLSGLASEGIERQSLLTSTTLYRESQRNWNERVLRLMKINESRSGRRFS